MTELVASDQSLPTFQANFQKAISETYRVLKQGRTFAMLLTSRIKEHFESYIMIAQTCGFELLNVKSIVEERQLPKSLAPVTAIAYFRKPFRKPALGADAAVTLKAIEQNRPVLFGALAELLIQELDGQDLAEFIPAHAKGTKPEIVMEVLADSDPRELLKEYLGRPGIRRVAAKLGVSGNTDTPDVLVDRVLVYFGFTIPAATADMNPTSALDQLKQIWTECRLGWRSCRCHPAARQATPRSGHTGWCCVPEKRVPVADRTSRLSELLFQSFGTQQERDFFSSVVSA